MTRVLLVTGARSLADSRDAERWARALIAEALADCDLLIVGDAGGPDWWARDTTSARCHCYIAFGPYAGRIYAWSGRAAVEPFDARWTHQRHQVMPLLRNAAMVADCKRLAAEGDTVSVLALLDGRKPAVTKPSEKRPTRGTEHTARLARAAGLLVDAQTWTPRGETT